MEMTKDERKEAVQGFGISRCAIRTKTIFSFLLVENMAENAEPAKRILNYFPNKPIGERIGFSEYNGFRFPKLAVSLYPKAQAVMVSLKSAVAVLGGGSDEIEQDIPNGRPEKPIYTSVHALATIDGYIYATGPWRAVCRRVGPNLWEQIGDRQTLPVPKRGSSGSSNEGFNAIAGFNAYDIYCVGGHGDAWRFDGKIWRQCALPTNMLLESVCCAGDGFVYIGMQSGSVMRGREDKWEMLHKGTMTLPFKDMVWYGDRVWCTSDYGIWHIVNGKLVEADLPVDIRACSGNLAVGDGVLLLAGMYGAAVFDGKKWERLV